MYKLTWCGNDGRCYLKPGIRERADCGICSTPMRVKRNVNGPTSSAGALSGSSHLYDEFTCPNLAEDWHEEVARLLYEAYSYISRHPIKDVEEMVKKETKKKITKILKKAEKQG